MAVARRVSLKRILSEYQARVQAEVSEYERRMRRSGAAGRQVLDAGEAAADEIQDDLDLAMNDLRMEMLRMIEGAIERVKDGTYGYCFDCGEEITEKRLKAVPFAVRCKNCEEHAEQNGRRPAVRRPVFDLSA
ncbi:MAG TPA: TraR/DksA family transcriptional regulator [Candidatus Paceibacterota bacterium]|nr:TraR/DksA family transcriptional regulator [Candidatus Paceibacterota bacterium]